MLNINVRIQKEMLLLDEDIYKYHYVSQGKITIPGIDDAEEAKLTDVSMIDTFHQYSAIMSSPVSQKLQCPASPANQILSILSAMLAQFKNFCPDTLRWKKPSPLVDWD